MLSTAQRQQFDRLGIVRLPQAIALPDVAAMCDQVWELLSGKHGIKRDDPTSWTVGKPWHFQTLSRAGVFNAMGSSPVTTALDELLGAENWRRPKVWGRPLVTFPEVDAAWEVPFTSWHTDGVGGEEDLHAVTAFAFLAPTAPGGGGTVVVTGSHHPVRQSIAASAADTPLHSSELKAQLASRHVWLRDLWTRDSAGDRTRRFLHDGAVVDGVPLRVVELTGDPGDVVLMNSRLLHAPAPNVLAVPRMMLVHITGRELESGTT
ncbi:phytanoyl-CoA dioxygenase family protein [Actinopolymorpha pittospori]